MFDLNENPSVSDYLEWIETLNHKTMSLGLERVSLVFDKLKSQLDISPKATVITVAGSNGKGSTIAALSSIYANSGYRVGAYTSPHLFSFNERIRVNGEMISDAALLEALSEVESARGDVPLTFYEYSTLACFCYFAKLNLDVYLLEVGLGGRLDAVNIIDADCAVITSISLDHTQYLGNTREAIAREKAGILRSNIPVIISCSRPPLSLIDCANNLNCKISCLNNEFGYTKHESTFDWWGGDKSLLALPIFGLHPDNLAGALQVIDILSDKLPVSDENKYNGLSNINITGRFQLETSAKVNNCVFIFDVAHNGASVEWLSCQLNTWLEKNKSLNDEHVGKVHAIFGVSNDKAIEPMLEPLKTIVDNWVITELGGERNLCNAWLQRYVLAICGTQPYTYYSVADAFHATLSLVRPGDCVLIFGSFITVERAMQLFRDLESQSMEDNINELPSLA